MRKEVEKKPRLSVGRKRERMNTLPSLHLRQRDIESEWRPSIRCYLARGESFSLASTTSG